MIKWQKKVLKFFIVCSSALFFIVCSSALFSTNCSTDVSYRYPDINLPFRPNIVWLVAEDMSPYLAAFGDHTVSTPNLNRLAEEGVRYTNVYSVSGVCAPSRFAIATGIYPTSAGAHNMRTQSGQTQMDELGLIPYEVVPPPTVRLMSEVLRRNGYFAINNSKTDYQMAHPVTAWDESSLRATWRTLIPDDKPFFAVFNFGITHESQIWSDAPKLPILRYDELFKSNPDPRYFDYSQIGEVGSFPNHVAEDLTVPIPTYLPDTEVVSRDLRRMYSNIVEMDRQIGIVLDNLKEDGLLDNTIIFFYSDHGGPLPRQKRLLYDSGLHVPMIIRFPEKLAAGTTDDQLISFVDLAPTMFSLAGIELPDYLEGQAFLGKLRAKTPRQYVFAAADRLDTSYDMIRAVRDKRYKYLRNFNPDQGYYLPVKYREQMATMQELLRLRDNGLLNLAQQQWFRESKPVEEIFDTWKDPHELNNLAQNPAYADKLVELRTQLEQWMEETEDKGFIPEAELIEQFWPGLEQPITAPTKVNIIGNRISLNSSTEGASIGYQIISPGDSPGERWQVYTEPITLNLGEQIYVVAHRLGYQPSQTLIIELNNLNY